MKLILATQNKGKLEEFSQLAKGTCLKFTSLPENTKFPKEVGATFKANALIKAKYIFNLTGMPVLADDSGLEVDCLEGRPGIRSARYSREATDQSNIDKLLDEMRGVKKSRRTARFKCSLIFIKDKLNNPLEAEGSLEGSIGTKRKGNWGFGYDSIFIVRDLGLHLAELEERRKNRISHRAEAFRLLSKKIL